MGLLDTRESPTYSPKLEKLAPIENFFSRIFSVRKDKVMTGVNHQKSVRIFGYHLLTQQGVPAGFKAGFVVIGAILPVLTFALVNGRSHLYKKDPFR